MRDLFSTTSQNKEMYVDFSVGEKQGFAACAQFLITSSKETSDEDDSYTTTSFDPKSALQCSRVYSSCGFSNYQHQEEYRIATETGQVGPRRDRSFWVEGSRCQKVHEEKRECAMRQ